MKAISQFTSHLSKNQASAYIPVILLSACCLTLFPDIAHAGTGGSELKGVFDKTLEMANGYGGKLAAATSFIISMIAAVRGNLIAFGSALGVSILAGVGPSVFTTGVAALI